MSNPIGTISGKLGTATITSIVRKDDAHLNGWDVRFRTDSGQTHLASSIDYEPEGGNGRRFSETLILRVNPNTGEVDWLEVFSGGPDALATIQSYLDEGGYENR